MNMAIRRRQRAPSRPRERIEQLLAEANLESTVTGEGADAAPVTVSNPVATANGIQWERRLGPHVPGRLTVTAAVRNGWRICETSSSIELPPTLVPCTLSVLPPMQLSDGQVRVGVGLWDFNNDYSDKSIFFHGGLDTPRRFAGSTVQWFAEGRLFLDMLDMIDNNYLAVTGLRMLWKDDTPAGSANPPGSR